MPVLRTTLMAATGLALGLQASALAGTGVTISSYGQRALLIQGGGQSVLLNPYRAVGCAAGLGEPRVNAGVILASSELAMRSPWGRQRPVPGHRVPIGWAA